jgi:hypothetical protein
MELLKDKPEFKETIENNFFFKNELSDIIGDIEVTVDFDDDKDEMITELVEAITEHCTDIKFGDEKVGDSLSDKQELAIAIFELLNNYTGEVIVENKKEIIDQVIEKMSLFVKENYGLSIKEAYLQSLSLL